MSAIQIEPWRTLASEGGSLLAFSGKRLAIAGEARLRVLQGNETLASVDAPSPAPGMPRFDGSKVYWGPGVLELATGNYEAIQSALPVRYPGGGERAQAYAWSPHGERLLASFSTGKSSHPTRVTLLDGMDGRVLAELFHGSSSAPQAAWLGARALVAGFENPRVYDHTGTPLAELGLGAAVVVSIAATDDERRLLAVDLNRGIAWIDTDTWTILDRWPGPWLHAAVSPDGRLVAAIEPWGKLHFSRMDGDRFSPIGVGRASPEAVALALTADEIATVGGGEVNIARLSVSAGSG